MANRPPPPDPRPQPRPDDPAPPAQPTPPAETGGAAADRLRAGIDSGATVDKVDHPDPAAAPLGTDAEAAGTPTDPAAMQHAAQKETARRPLAEDRPDPRRMQERSARNRLLALAALVVLFGLVALIWG